MNNEINWQWLQLFVVVAQEGSFSKAAARLNQSQPTLSRQIQQFEKQINQLLFHRSPKGLSLTGQGQVVFEKAQSMQDIQDGLLRQINGQDEALTGSIRVSANEVMGFYALPSIIAKFSKIYPEVEIELVVTNQSSSLSKREADIALRMYQPAQPDLIAQKVADLPLCLFASSEYLKINGHPKDIDDMLLNHKMIGFDQDLQMVEAFKKRKKSVILNDFFYRCDHLLMQIKMIQNGCAIGVTHKKLQEVHDIVALFDAQEVANLPLWVVCHQEVKFNKKVELFKAFLVENLRENPYQI